MTTLADGRHRPRVRQAQYFATLQAAQELSGLDTSGGRQWWGANLTVKPHQRLAGAPLHAQVMSYLI
jgi:hypothetical protein